MHHESINSENRMLIKMEMKNVVYTETAAKQKSGMEVWLNKSYRWILEHFGVSKRDKPFMNPLLNIERH